MGLVNVFAGVSIRFNIKTTPFQNPVLLQWGGVSLTNKKIMDVTGPTQMAILTTMMSQQVQQMAEIQKMIAETTVKLAEMSSDPNLGQYINIRA